MKHSARRPGIDIKYHDLYCIRDEMGRVKLGKSGCLQARFREIQSGSGGKLTYEFAWPALGKLETKVKNYLNLCGYHIHSEWYYVDLPTLKRIVEIVRMDQM